MEKNTECACYINTIEECLVGLETKCDRFTPTDIGMWMNAQALIDMAKLRLCNHASKETREVMIEIKKKVKEVDPDLAKFMVRKCVYRNGICGESCGFNHSNIFLNEQYEYLKNFNDKQKPL